MATIEEEMEKALTSDKEMEAALSGETIKPGGPWWMKPAEIGLETAGTLAGGLAGAPLGPAGAAAGAGLGYAGTRQLARRGKELLGYAEPQGPLKAAGQAAMDIPTGAAMEAGGQVVNKGLKIAMDYLGPHAMKAAQRLYGSAIKAPLSRKWVQNLTGEDVSKRTRAIQAGIEGEVPPSEVGLQMVKKMESETRGMVDSITAQGAKSGDTVLTEDLIDKGFKRAYQIAEKSSDPVGARKILDSYAEKFRAHGETIPVDKLNSIKRQLYDEVTWQAAQKTGLVPQLKEAYKKGLAHEAMTVLEGKYPALDSLNAKDGALIDLKEAIERAIGRMENREIVSLGTKVLVGKESWPLAVLNATIGHPQVKTRLSFALSKVKAIQGSPMGSRLLSYELTPRMTEE